MSKVLIVGAKNTIGSLVRKNLLAQTENHLNLLDTTKIEDYDKVREASFSGDLANDDVLDEAISGQDIVLVDVDSELPQISKAIVKSMKKNNVSRIIFMSTMGVYNEVNSNGFKNDISSELLPYRASADIVENSGLDYTIIRPGHYDAGTDMNYQLTFKGEALVGREVSKVSVVDLISRIIKDPNLYKIESLGITRA